MEVGGMPLSILVAIAICAVNTAAGYAISKWAFGKELNTFLGIVFGSFGVRAIVVIALVWLCISVLKFHQVAFSITFAMSSFIFLMLEIFFFHQSFEKAKRTVRRPVSDLLKKKPYKIVAPLMVGFLGTTA